MRFQSFTLKISFIYLKGKARERRKGQTDRDFPPSGQISKYPQWPEKKPKRSQEAGASSGPRWVQGPKALAHLPMISRELNQNLPESSQDANMAGEYFTCCTKTQVPSFHFLAVIFMFKKKRSFQNMTLLCWSLLTLPTGQEKFLILHCST